MDTQRFDTETGPGIPLAELGDLRQAIVGHGTLLVSLPDGRSRLYAVDRYAKTAHLIGTFANPGAALEALDQLDDHVVVPDQQSPVPGRVESAAPRRARRRLVMGLRRPLSRATHA